MIQFGYIGKPHVKEKEEGRKEGEKQGRKTLFLNMQNIYKIITVSRNAKCSLFHLFLYPNHNKLNLDAVNRMIF